MPTNPGEHPYESGPDNICIHCGQIGSYAHTPDAQAKFRATNPEERAEPTFDADGYPTEDTLDRIRTWPIDTMAAAAEAMDFAGRAWSYPDRWSCVERWEDPDWPSHPKRVYEFSTGGWSGNESIVAAIEGNAVLQMLGAWSWRRGGHYEYRFPLPESSND